MEWVHQTPELRVAVDWKPSILTATDPFVLDALVAEREVLAVSARHAWGFRVQDFGILEDQLV